MRNAMLINEKDNVIVAIEPLSKGTKAVYQVNGRSEEVKCWRIFLCITKLPEFR